MNLWPFRRRPTTEKTTKDVRVHLTEVETLACARLLDADHANPKNRDFETGAVLWQWVKRTLGDRYIPGCRMRIDTEDRAQYSVIFYNTPIEKIPTRTLEEVVVLEQKEKKP